MAEKAADSGVATTVQNPAPVSPPSTTAPDSAESLVGGVKPPAEPAAQPSQQEGSTTAPEGEKKTPEKYELTLPEGSFLDEGALERTASYAKERGLSNEEAQEILNQKATAVTEYVDSVKARAEGWIDDSKRDKEVGGEAFTKNVELARRALERFGSADLKRALNESGFGNHPEVVRVFMRIGKAMSEDSFVKPGAQSPPAKRTIEEIFYGSPPVVSTAAGNEEK